MLRIPTARRQFETSLLFTSVTEKLNLGATKKQTQVVIRAGLEPGIAGLRFDTLTTQPCCLGYAATYVIVCEALRS